MTQIKASPCIFCHTETPIKGEGLCWLCKYEHYTKKRLIKKTQEENKKSIIIKVQF
tara:strand:+ start:219 stop:386 length:168 start_codon:yes stop_codon:yes gene_type:complete